MAKTEWGTKRTCLSCGARFYDLQRSPAPCPKCGAEFDPDQGQKSRRPKVAAPVPIRPVVEPAKVNGADDDDTKDDDDLVKIPSDDEKDVGASVIEDTSELGEDEDDVSVVRGRGGADKATE